MIFCKSLPVLLMVLIGLPLWPQGRIVRPVDGASVASGKLSILATAPNGRIEFDGKPLAAEARFPDVFEATVQPSPGEHTIRLVWEGGFEEIRIWYGPNAPEGFLAFRSHPPAAVECTQCHAVSRRGRFRFSGGCFDCPFCEREEGRLRAMPHGPRSALI